MSTGRAFLQMDVSGKSRRQETYQLDLLGGFQRQETYLFAVRQHSHCSYLDYRHRVYSMVSSLRPKKQSVPRKYSLQSQIAWTLTEQYLYLFFAAMAIILSVVRFWNHYLEKKLREWFDKYLGSTESTASLGEGRRYGDEVGLV